MKYEELEKKLRKQIEAELRERGVSSKDLNPEEVRLKKSGNKMKISYQDIEIIIPAPSQEAIDAWWKDASKYITGSLITLAGVAIGILATKKKD